MERFYNLKEINKYLVISLICIICYWNSLFCDFAFDDMTAIKDNKDIRSYVPISNILFNDFWGTPLTNERSHKSYRPLTVLTFRLNYLIHELNPFGYHLTNVILHCLVTCIYLRTIKLFVNDKVSFLAAILFAVHPIHTEAVTGVVGRAELLSSIFFLWTLLLYHKNIKLNKYKNYFFIFMTLTCSMFSKEQGITIAGICIIYELFFIQNINPIKLLTSIVNSFKDVKLTKSGIKRILFLIGSTIILLFIRILIMGSKLPFFTKFDNPASAEGFPKKQLTFMYLVYVNLKLLFYPCDLCCDWTMGTIPIINDFSDIRNVATLFTFIILLILGLSCIFKFNQHSKIVIMSLSLLILPYLPASNLFFPVGFVIAERVLYMPSMGYCLLIAYGHFRIQKKFKSNIFNVFILFLILSHCIKTIHRNFDWTTEYTIFLSGIRVNRNNAKLFNNVGHALENIEKYSDALDYFKKATEVEKSDIGAYINVGRTYKNLNEYALSEQYYNIAKALLPKPKKGSDYHTRVAPHYLNVFLSLSKLIAMNESRLEEADLLLQNAISLRSDFVQAYINRGDILMKLNRSEDARKVYEVALLYETDNPDIYYNLGVVLLNQEKNLDALNYFEKAISLNPNHELALLNSAILMQETGKARYIPIAKKRFSKLLQKNDKNERVYFNLGMIAMDEDNPIEAIEYFKRSIELKEDFRSALFNLALLLSDVKKPLEAIPYLKQLIKYHPSHTKGLILLGDIYINELKDLDSAEMCYNQILLHEPENIQGIHNLCVVYVERGNLKDALKCLETAHAMAPHEDYILRHLNIVKSKILYKN